MGEIDVQTRHYLRDPVTFADAFNFLLYKGKQVIDPASLSPMDTAELVIPFRSGTGKAKQGYRDNLNLWAGMKGSEAIYLILGIESQSYIHYALPVKTGLYDFMNYAEQVEGTRNRHKFDFRQGQETEANRSSDEFLSGFRKEDRLLPVITLTIYFGDKEWDGPLTIHKMLSVQDPELLRFVPDYQANLITPCIIPAEDFDLFRSRLGVLLEYIRYSGDKERLRNLVLSKEVYRHVDRETAVMIKLLTGSEINMGENEEVIDVCQAYIDMKQEGFEEGIEKGIEKGRQEGIEKGREEGFLEALSSLVKDGILTISDAARRANLSPSEFRAKTVGMK